MKEALLWEKTLSNSIRCLLCMRKCIIDDGHSGWCETRMNQGGVLYSLTYGNVASMSVSPIERKPMNHFFPGSLWLSVGSYGCNFRCHGCQSWDFSHCDVKKSLGNAHYVPPEMLVRKAKKNRVQGIAFTYNEPTMWFEYVLDVFKLAKESSLSTCLVTNGYMTPQALELLGPYTDGFCLDVKGAFMESYTRLADISDVNIIFSNGSDAKRRYAMHVEIVTNIIPGFNSHEKEVREVACWLFAELGKDTPWHLTRFFPYGELRDVTPTPLTMLEGLRNMGIKEGLMYVYIGNIPGHAAAHTYCQQCKRAVIKRHEYDEIESKLVDGHCPYCKSIIFGRFPY